MTRRPWQDLATGPDIRDGPSHPRGAIHSGGCLGGEVRPASDRQTHDAPKSRPAGRPPLGACSFRGCLREQVPSQLLLVAVHECPGIVRTAVERGVPAVVSLHRSRLLVMRPGGVTSIAWDGLVRGRGDCTIALPSITSTIAGLAVRGRDEYVTGRYVHDSGRTSPLRRAFSRSVRPGARVRHRPGGLDGVAGGGNTLGGLGPADGAVPPSDPLTLHVMSWAAPPAPATRMESAGLLRAALDAADQPPNSSCSRAMLPFGPRPRQVASRSRPTLGRMPCRPRHPGGIRERARAAPYHGRTRF